MLEQVRAGVVQRAAHSIFSYPDAVQKNGEEVAAAIRAAAGTLDLLVFPELALTGYIPLKGYDQKRKAIMWEAAQVACDQVVPALAWATAEAGVTVVVGTPEPAGPRYEMFNSAVVLDHGRVAGWQRKLHLPVEENHYFVPGPAAAPFDTRVGRIAAMVCYDMVFPEVARLQAMQGAEILVFTSNWIDDADLTRLGAVLPVARALENEVHVIFCNGVGELSVRQYTYNLYGKSTIVSATGEVLAQADGSAGQISAVLEKRDLLNGSRVFPVFRDRRIDLFAPLARAYPGRAGAEEG